MSVCSIEGCERKRHARKLCATHYHRQRRGHDVSLPLRDYRRGSLNERLWRRVVRGALDACWPWTGTRTERGYGQIRAGGQGSKLLATHRVAYELVVGPIPDGLVIDHLCRNTSCCNPAHLEPVTQAENIRRGERHP